MHCLIAHLMQKAHILPSFLVISIGLLRGLDSKIKRAQSDSRGGNATVYQARYNKPRELHSIPVAVKLLHLPKDKRIRKMQVSTFLLKS